MQHLDELVPELGMEPAYPGHVRFRPVNACYKPCLDGVDTAGEEDRNRGCERLGDQCRIVARNSRDQGNLARDQLSRQRPQPVHLIVRVAVFDQDVATLGIARLIQALPKRLRMMSAVAG